MTNLDEKAPGTDSAAAVSSPENRSAATIPAANGTASPSSDASTQQVPAQGTIAGQNSSSGSDRAEGVAHRVGYLVAAGAGKLVSFLSRTREALQDFWAEVQDFRHGRKP
jgi:hypothetical protein